MCHNFRDIKFFLGGYLFWCALYLLGYIIITESTGLSSFNFRGGL